MNLFAKQHYILESKKKEDEIISSLRAQTLQKRSLSMEKTSFDFIGEVSASGFKLISSWFPLGTLCVMEGKVKTKHGTHISLHCQRNKAFELLFILWTIGMAVLLFIGDFQNPYKNKTPYFLFLISIGLFRLFINFLYVKSRYEAMDRLRNYI